VKEQRPIPPTPKDWLNEIALAFQDAFETLPFGVVVGHDMKPADLFHLGPVVCLKFRGIRNTKSNLKRATDAALASYVATYDAVGDLFDIPQMSFAFCYVASHLGLNLLDEETCSHVLDYVEANLAILVEMTEET